jgi:lipopolysaccharide export system protein LptC
MPHYEDGGQTLTLRINADSAERTGETTFNFKGLRLELFDDSEETPAMEVILSEAVFDRETNLLTSQTNALIKGEQFEITGSQLEFDSKTRDSRLAGPVAMTLTSTGEDGQP